MPFLAFWGPQLGPQNRGRGGTLWGALRVCLAANSFSWRIEFWACFLADFVAAFGANLGQLEPTWGQDGANLGPSWAKFGPTLAILGVLGASRG